MSDIPRSSLDWQEQTARIDRALADMGKLIEEQNKLRAERRKLNAGRRRYNRDPWLIIAAAIIGAAGLVAARLPEIITALHSH